jgi:hypothetical protein
MKYDPDKRIQWVWMIGLSSGGFMYDEADRMLVILFPPGCWGLLIRLKPKKAKVNK